MRKKIFEKQQSAIFINRKGKKQEPEGVVDIFEELDKKEVTGGVISRSKIESRQSVAQSAAERVKEKKEKKKKKKYKWNVSKLENIKKKKALVKKSFKQRSNGGEDDITANKLKRKKSRELRDILEDKDFKWFLKK